MTRAKLGQFDKTVWRLYHAIVVLHGDDESGPRTHESERDKAECLETIHEFRRWLAKTKTTDHLTPESASTYQARATVGVSVKREGGSVVIRVPTGAK